tara:strand:+ start:75 stop:275 length:201 start_codon:yes stop_codon:yes gene_type:complete
MDNSTGVFLTHQISQVNRVSKNLTRYLKQGEIDIPDSEHIYCELEIDIVILQGVLDALKRKQAVIA